MGRDQRQLALWILGLAVALGSVGPNLHALLGCHCQLCSLGQIVDWTTATFAFSTPATPDDCRQLVSSQQSGDLIPCSDCFACRVLAGAGLWPPTSKVHLLLDAGARQLGPRDLAARTIEVCNDCLPRGPPLEIS